MSCDPRWQTHGAMAPTQGCRSKFRKLFAEKPAEVARIATKIISTLHAEFIHYSPHFFGAR
jgi:hypothetical protein